MADNALVLDYKKRLMSRKDDIMMTMNGWWEIKFEDTDWMRDLFRYTPIDIVLDYHWIPKIWKNSWKVYFNYPIELHQKHVQVVDQYFEDNMNPFQNGYIEAKKFYLLRKQNEQLNNNEWNNNGEENRTETVGIWTDWNDWASIEGDTWVEKESESTDGTLGRKMTAKRRWRVKGRRKSK